MGMMGGALCVRPLKTGGNEISFSPVSPVVSPAPQTRLLARTQDDSEQGETREDETSHQR